MDTLLTNPPDPLETRDASSIASSFYPKPHHNNVKDLPSEVAGLIGEVTKNHERLVRCEGRVRLFMGLQERKVGTD